MALKRSFLSAMGIEADKIDEIIEAHVETVNGLKDEIDTYKAKADKVTELMRENESLKEQAKNGEDDAYKVKYDALKEEYDAFKTEQSEKATRSKKENAYKEILKEAGVSEKRIDTVLRVSDVDKLEFDEDGKVKGVEELTENVKNEWSDFIVDTGVKGAKIENPPSNNGGKLTKDEIFAIDDPIQRQEAIAENIDLFE